MIPSATIFTTLPSPFKVNSNLGFYLSLPTIRFSDWWIILRCRFEGWWKVNEFGIKEFFSMLEANLFFLLWEKEYGTWFCISLDGVPSSRALDCIHEHHISTTSFFFFFIIIIIQLPFVVYVYFTAIHNFLKFWNMHKKILRHALNVTTLPCELDNWIDVFECHRCFLFCSQCDYIFRKIIL